MEVFHNFGTIEDPQVNARNFINDGDITAVGIHPWTAQNTVTFTNRGTMYGAVGFRFETVTPPFGFTSPANVFVNGPTGDILAQDASSGIVIGVGGESGVISDFITTSLIKINAINLTNRGVLNVGANGFIQLHGVNVDVTGGALIVGDIDDPLSGGGFGSGFPSQNDTNFFPSPGIYDDAWAISSFTNVNIQNILLSVDPSTVSTPTPSPSLTNDFGGTVGGAILLDEALLWTRQEVIDETNEVVQLIAVQVSDPSINVLADFVDLTFWDGQALGGYLTAAIELQVPSTDFATLERVTNSVHIFDQLGASTNRALMLNFRDGTYRPGNFVVTRSFPANFLGLRPPEVGVRPDLITARLDELGYSVPYLGGPIFTNEWAGYNATIESVPVRLPSVPGVAVTNLGGQVEINAKNLTLRNTRIRGEGFVSLTGTNVLLNGVNLIDAPRLSLYLGSGAGNLTVNELIPDAVERFNGSFEAYSTVFTNYYERYVTNPPANTGGEETIDTNAVEVRFQVTIVDARGLQTLEPVTVYDLKLTSTNNNAVITFNENVAVNNSVRIDAREVTFGPGSSLDVPPGWAFTYSNVVNVRIFNNFGAIFASEFVDLRTDASTPFERFVNTGVIVGNGVFIAADELINTNGGAIFSQTVLDLRAQNLTVDGGTLAANRDITLNADNAEVAGLEISTGGRLILNISQSLNDRGAYIPNSFSTEGGVEMIPPGPSGNLLGTTIILDPPPLDFVDFIWAADDRGASASAFDNNLALGGLVLDGGNFSLFQFLPAHEGAALYVDLLEINGYHAESLDVLTNNIVLGMNIYYSDVVSTNPYISAQALNRVFGPDAQNNLIWVPEFVGPSSVEVQLGQNGGTSLMKRSLRMSLVVDSDGDGIPNALDEYPLTPAEPGDQLELRNARRTGAGISFNLSGAGSAKFVIEYTTNLTSGNWEAITEPLTANDTEALQSFSDSIAQGSTQGYYRVKLVQ
jgi:hypothetical protein